MSTEIQNAIEQSVLKIIGTLSGETPHRKEALVRGESLTKGSVTALIGMAGENVSGNLAISFDTGSITFIVGKMLLESFDSVTSDVIDAAGEICNMLAGDIKRSLSEVGYEFEMARPTMVVGQQRVDQLSSSRVITLTFTLGSNMFWVDSTIKAV